MSKVQQAKAWIDQTGDEGRLVWVLANTGDHDSLYIHRQDSVAPYLPVSHCRVGVESFAGAARLDARYVPRRAWLGMLRATCPMQAV